MHLDVHQSFGHFTACQGYPTPARQRWDAKKQGNGAATLNPLILL
jgi:hypothetical protein